MDKYYNPQLSSIWKTLEKMTDIPGAVYKATCRVVSTQQHYHASGFRQSTVLFLAANDRVLVKESNSRIMVYIIPAGAFKISRAKCFFRNKHSYCYK
jgi:hypothetical protein